MGLQSQNNILAGTNLARAAIESPNFVTGVSGWIIRQDGSAEFNNVVVRGTVTSGHFVGTGTGTEILIYSGTPAAGNLVASIVSAAFIDAFGNHGLSGITEYANNATQLNDVTVGGLVLYTGSLAAGWTAVASVAFGVGSTLRLADVNGIVLANTVTATAGTPSAPTIVTTDSWNAMTLANNWANVAGYATARYRMTAGKQVEVVAAINAAAATASTFFTMAAPYIPASQQPVSGAGASGNVPAGLAPWCRIDTSGNLTVQNTGAVGAAWQFFVHGFYSLDA